MQEHNLREAFLDKYSWENDSHVIVCDCLEAKTILSNLKNNFGFNMLLDICGVDYGLEKSTRFACVYHLLNMDTNQRLRLKILLKEQEKVESATFLWKGAQWFERESWDMMGISFTSTSNERILNPSNLSGHPLRKNFPLKYQPLEDKKAPPQNPSSWTPITPSHPAQTGTLKVEVLAQGRKVEKTKIEIGFLHRCFEKICESRMYNQIITYTDRLNYCSPAMNNIGWAKAVESLMGIEISDQTKAFRMIMAELSRIIDHSFCIGVSARDIGALENFWHCWQQRENVLALFEKYCGARITVSLTRIGGMAFPITRAWLSECQKTTQLLYKSIKDLESRLTGSILWMERTKVCPIDASSALDWGYTGPCLRACGINYDIRKNSPYYFYGDVDFEIPLGINGDCYDRYLVRIEEMYQSLHIINQLLESFPSSQDGTNLSKVMLPPKEQLPKDSHKLAKHFSIINDGICPPQGEIYSATEAANGELGFYIISKGEKCPDRVKVRPPCFTLLQSYPQLVQGAFLADALTALNSLNIVAGELDR